MNTNAKAATPILLMTTLIVMLWVATAAAQQRDVESWSIEQLMVRMAEVDSARAHFTETRNSALFAAPLILTGTLFYERPSKIERKVNTPYEERFAADGDTLVIENSERAQARSVTLSSQPVMRAFVESIRSTLAGDQTTLARFYSLKLIGSPSQWALQLVPAGAEFAEYVSFIRITGVDNRIVTIEVLETDGAQSVMTITYK